MCTRLSVELWRSRQSRGGHRVGVTLRAVKFVSYDEALYERLVEINAIAKNGTAQVQTEDTELGWL